MGFLIPLYMAGLAALSLPFLFHLVRRTPRGRQEFSSLMFLTPSVPKLTRRSRLDQILLLLLRLLALACVAFAFARPFLREASLLSLADLNGRRVAILLDTSASLRRGDLWQKALAEAGKQLDELNPQDDVALFTYDRKLSTVIDFVKRDGTPIEDKPEVVRSLLKKLQPSWQVTDLGTALVAVASELDTSTDAQQSPLEPLIVVISDFQAGSRLDAVRSFEWPKNVPVVTRNISLEKTTNAFVHLLPNEEGEELSELRVRVVNAADSKSDQFFLAWGMDKGPVKSTKETPVYVPAGQSRVVHLTRGPDDLLADRIVLRGDDQDFDNTCFVVPPLKLAATILYTGDDQAADPEGLQYYLKLAVANDPLRDITLKTVAEQQPLSAPGETAPQLVVVSKALSEERQKELERFVERGGTLLFVPENARCLSGLAPFFPDVEIPNIPVGESPAQTGNQYQLLGEIDFKHPLFAPVSGTRYSDFTKVHFWKHFPVKLKSPSTTHVVARFDNHDPALIENLKGKGRVLALLSGWQPRDSQFSVSSKFVPFIGALLDLACGVTASAASSNVGDTVTLPREMLNQPVAIQTPDGRTVKLQTGAEGYVPDTPGIYSVSAGAQATRFAANLPIIESNTAPLDLEQLEQSGVRVGTELSRDEKVERMRQHRDSELENQQKIWRWLIVLALGLLIFETWFAGRQERAIRNEVPQ